MGDQHKIEREREQHSSLPTSKEGVRATWAFTLPALKWAMFYCQTYVPSQHSMKGYVFLGDGKEYDFTVLASNGFIGEYQNPNNFDTDYAISAALFPLNDFSEFPDYLSSFTTDVKADGAQFFFPTGETDGTGNQVGQTVRLVIQKHP